MTAEIEVQENVKSRNANGVYSLPLKNVSGKYSKIFRLTDKRRSYDLSASNDGINRPLVSLKKNIGFVSCLGILIGSIIGSGIFVSPKGVLIGCGSVGLSLVIWALCGLLTLIGCMVYAELGILLPHSGGNYFYLLDAFHPNRKLEKSYLGSLVPFLYFWQTCFLLRPAVTAVQGMAIAQYLIQLFYFGDCNSISKEVSYMFTKLIAALFIVTVTALNCYSNKVSTRIINLLTFIKLLAITFIIVSGIIKLSQGTNEALHTGFEGTTYKGIANAFYSGTWAFAGWNKLNLVTRELANPKRDLLRSMVTTCGIVTTLYLLVNVSYFAVMSKEAFLTSNAVAASFAEEVIGKIGSIYIIASVALSIFGSTLGENFTGNRIMYAAAREGHMTKVMSFIHYDRMTPSAALIFNGFLALLLVPQSSVFGLISLSGFVSAIFSFLTVLSLLILRRNRKKDDDNFHVPFIFILISLATSLAFVVEPFVSNPKIEFVYVLAFMFAGIFIYTPFIYYRKTLPIIDPITLLIQKILLVVPPEDEDV